LDPATWGAEIDENPPYTMRYDLAVQQIDLESLEFLSNPVVDPNTPEFTEKIQTYPPPFGNQYTYQREQTEPFVDASLFDVDGVCYVAHASRTTVHIADVVRCKTTTFHLGRDGNFANYDHRIRTIRVLPQQNRVLVFRTIVLVGVLASETHDVHMIEVFDIPEVDNDTYERANNTQRIRTAHAVDRVYIEGKHVVSVHISDYPTISKSLDLPPLYEHKDNTPLTPVSIYVRTTKPWGIVHYELFPVRNPDTNEWSYVLDSVIPQTVHISDPIDTRVIPGTTRSLVYTVPGDDRSDHPKLLSLRRYFNPRYAPDDYKSFVVKDHLAVPVLDKDRYPKPTLLYSSFDSCDPTYNGINEKGVSAIAWDEGTGRVCIAARGDMEIVIMDLGRVINASDPRFEEWRKAVTLLREAQGTPPREGRSDVL
ncbi:hypothetical protein V5O48_009022, partial [Marasmius crinis-equi]